MERAAVKTNFKAKIGRKNVQFREGNIKDGEISRKHWAYVEGYNSNSPHVVLSPLLKNANKRSRTEILLHEALHLIAPGWQEKRVTKAAKDLARLLRTAGEI